MSDNESSSEVGGETVQTVSAACVSGAVVAQEARPRALLVRAHSVLGSPRRFFLCLLGLKNLSGGGAMGFFDVVAPMVLNEVEVELKKKKEREVSSGGGNSAGGRVSLANSEISKEEDDSSSDMSKSDSNAVGLFDAMEGESMPIVGGTELVDRRQFTIRHKNTFRTHADSLLFKQDDMEVLGILNYGEDKVVTHERDCLRVWDLASRKPLVRFDVQVRRIKKYNHWLFCIDTDSEDVLQLDLRDNELKPNRFTGLEEEATAIAINNFIGFGVTLFAITKDSFSYAWRCPPVEAAGHDIEIETKFKGHTQNVTSLDLGDNYLYTSSTDKTVRVWNYENGSCVRTLAGHTDWVFSVKVIGKDVYSGSRDETVRVWNSEGECISIIKLGALAYGVLLEENYLYIRDALKRVVICEAKKGNKIVGIAEGSSGNVKSIVIYKNVLVTAAENDNLVRVWSAEDGSLLAVLKGHTDAVNGLALFGPGLILSASEDGSVRQWDLKQVFEGVLATAGPGADAKGATPDKLTKARSVSIFGKPRSSSDSKPRTNRNSIFGAKPRSDSTGSVTQSADITPAAVANFQRAIKPILKTQKVKGQFYPSSFTGKDLVAWVKSNVTGCDSSKAALLYGAALAREGAFEVVTGKSVADSSSCVLKLK